MLVLFVINSVSKQDLWWHHIKILLYFNNNLEKKKIVADLIMKIMVIYNPNMFKLEDYLIIR